MNRYSVRIVEKTFNSKLGITETSDILNVLVSGNSKKDARRMLRQIDGGKYNNAANYRIGRITLTSREEEDGFSIPINTAEIKRHWEL